MSGILRGFDPYMNLVLDDCVEERSSQQKFNIGMVVRQINVSGYVRNVLKINSKILIRQQLVQDLSKTCLVNK